MKKTLLIAISVLTLASCEKSNLFDGHKEDKPCAVVGSESMPSAVTASFQEKYPGISVDKWFNKDNVGYCALFTLNGKKTISQFNNDGTFVKEDIEIDQEGNHEDDNDNDSGCECEIEEED